MFLSCGKQLPKRDPLQSRRTKWMVHWSVRVYDEEFELFFEREAYEKGLVAMLHEIVTPDAVFTVPYSCSPYEDKDEFVEKVKKTLAQRSYFTDMWNECEEATAS